MYKRLVRKFPMLLCLALHAFAFHGGPASAQVDAEPNGAGPAAPFAEKFEKADGLVTPWVHGGCIKRSGALVREPDCDFVTNKLLHEHGTVTLYDRKGSVWQRLVVIFPHPETFTAKKIPGFEPLAVSQLVMRITAESENWYEVEINQTTGDVRYVSKSDPLWVKRDWRYFFEKAGMVNIDGSRIKLRTSPGGEIAERTADMSFTQVIYRDMDGEWMYVEAFDLNNRYYGWIQYRKDYRLLVGCWLTYFKIPE